MVSLLPRSLSYVTYFWIQKHFGALRDVNPTSHLTAAVQIWRLIQQAGRDPSGKVFLEVGTGRVPTVPLAYWLMGAKGTATFDLNPYMSNELVVDSLHYMSRNRDAIREVFGSLLDSSRFDELLAYFDSGRYSIEGLLSMAGINYFAPGDAANTDLADRSIDFHTSYSVFEHIPPEVLKSILAEGNRLISDDGLFVHRIDYSDHFAHSDTAISPINFLQFSEIQWKRYAGNRFMYMNRLRHDDYEAMFESMGHKIVLQLPDVNQQLAMVLKSEDFQLDDCFRSKPEAVLLITGACFISCRKNVGSSPAK